MSVEKLNVVTAQGANCYAVGHKVGGEVVARIEVVSMRTNGDLYEHYCGFDENDTMLFSVDKLCPCDVTYK